MSIQAFRQADAERVRAASDIERDGYILDMLNNALETQQAPRFSELDDEIRRELRNENFDFQSEDEGAYSKCHIVAARVNKKRTAARQGLTINGDFPSAPAVDGNGHKYLWRPARNQWISRWDA